MSESDSILLEAGAASARVFRRGAQCRAWRIGARDMLWPGDPAIWPDVAPVLFPTCGWSRGGKIRMGAKTYPMPVHGFAAQSAFTAQQLSGDAVRMVLEASDETRRFYPFDFTLAVTYRLAADALSVEMAVTNRSAEAMPYACGLHPGFTWDRSAGPYRFAFEKPERAEVPVIAPGGLFSDRVRPVPLDGRSLDLTPGLFAAEALCFLNTQSRLFTFAGPEGTLSVDAPDFPHLVLWNRDAAPFLAIESWTGAGDPEGFEGDFRERPSMIHLLPGESRAHRLSYRWSASLSRLGTSPLCP